MFYNLYIPKEALIDVMLVLRYLQTASLGSQIVPNFMTEYGAMERNSMVQLAGGCGAWFLYSIAPKQINGRLDASVVRVVILVDRVTKLSSENSAIYF